MNEQARRGIRAAQGAILVNAVLAVVKLAAGVTGHAYALVADAVESTADILASTMVLGSLQISARDPDDEFPFGYGKAEALAAAVVALMILAASLAIAIEAIGEILTPHHSPAAWTLAVLVAVVATKWLLARRVASIGAAIGSTAVKADAKHHLSDAITSAAAFVGISIAVIGGPGWEAADDWAALFAAGVITINGVNMLRPALDDLMDRTPGVELLTGVRRAADSVAGVMATEKLAARKSGLGYRVTIHIQANPALSLHDAHILGGKVKGAIMTAVPQVRYVLVHMEPFEQPR